MRRLGVMLYMMPLQRATESSRMPKSVMKTTVGGGCVADCCAGRGVATRSTIVAATHNKTRCEQNIRADFLAGVNVIRIKVEFSERIPSLLRHHSASRIYNRER